MRFVGQLQKRVGWLDTIRALAILLVVCNHSIEKAYTLNVESMLGYAWYSRMMALTFFTLGRLGVPLFFFLSGYLLLDRRYDSRQTRRFYQRNLLGLLVTTEVWAVLYNLFNSWYYETPLSLKTLGQNLLFFKQVNMGHMWYMPVILGIYLFIPFVANALSGTQTKTLYIPAVIAFVYLYVRVELNAVLAAFGHEAVGSVLDVSFSGGRYGFYLLVGYLVKKGVLDRIPGPALGTTLVLGFAVTVGVQFLSYENGVKYNVWYDNATLLLAALALFVLLSRVQISHPLMENLAHCSFGIYLVHVPVLLLLGRYMELPRRIFQFAATAVITLLISWLLVWFVGKSRWAAKWLFAMK